MAFAYDMLADVYMPSHEYHTLALEAARKAVANDSLLAEARALLGYELAAANWDFAAGRLEMERGLALNPNSTDAVFIAGLFAWITGDTARAVPLADRLIRLDPLSPLAARLRAESLQWDGRQAEALEQDKIATKLDPMVIIFESTKGHALRELGRLDESVEHFSISRSCSTCRRGGARWRTVAWPGATRRFASSARLRNARRNNGWNRRSSRSPTSQLVIATARSSGSSARGAGEELQCSRADGLGQSLVPRSARRSALAMLRCARRRSRRRSSRKASARRPMFPPIEQDRARRAGRAGRAPTRLALTTVVMRNLFMRVRSRVPRGRRSRARGSGSESAGGSESLAATRALAPSLPHTSSHLRSVGIPGESLARQGVGARAGGNTARQHRQYCQRSRGDTLQAKSRAPPTNRRSAPRDDTMIAQRRPWTVAWSRET